MADTDFTKCVDETSAIETDWNFCHKNHSTAYSPHPSQLAQILGYQIALLLVVTSHTHRSTTSSYSPHTHHFVDTHCLLVPTAHTDRSTTSTNSPHPSLATHVPASATRPLSITMILSASRIVDNRCATVMTVQSPRLFRRAACTTPSDCASKALVASSSKRIFGLRTWQR